MRRLLSSVRIIVPVFAALSLCVGWSAAQDPDRPAELGMPSDVPSPPLTAPPCALPEAAQRPFGYEGPAAPPFSPAPRDKQAPLVWMPPEIENDRGLPIDLPT